MPKIIVKQSELVMSYSRSEDADAPAEIIEASVSGFGKQVNRKRFPIFEPKLNRCLQYVRECVALCKTNGFTRSFGSKICFGWRRTYFYAATLPFLLSHSAHSLNRRK